MLVCSFGSNLCNNVDIVFGKRVSGDIRHMHISGVARTDNQYFRPGIDHIFDIVGIKTMTLLAPPIVFDLAADDFQILVVGMAVNDHMTAGCVMFNHFWTPTSKFLVRGFFLFQAALFYDSYRFDR
jgi:hypothetical protein